MGGSEGQNCGTHVHPLENRESEGRNAVPCGMYVIPRISL